MHYKLAIIGFGGVNRAFVELIDDHAQFLAESSNLTFEIVAVSDIFLGSVVNRAGIPLRTLRELPVEKGALARFDGGVEGIDNGSLIENCGADILVEATFTNAETGEPAVSYCRTALKSGMHVVTTNKGPIAFHVDELGELAAENGVGIQYEGTVMSGTPVLRLAEMCLPGNRIKGFRGILNGTANYILGEVEKGSTVQNAIEGAQQLGYAEADPTADIEGFDVMLKVVILANQLLDCKLSTKDVVRKGISALSEQQIRDAVKNGKRWKLIGAANISDSGEVHASVQPVQLDADDILAGISGPTNAVCIDTELLGEVMVSGPGAGKTETAYALLSDIIAIKSKPGSGL